MSDSSVQALQLVRTALANFEFVPLSNTLRTAVRIARLMRDFRNLIWLDWELRDREFEENSREILYEISDMIDRDEIAELLRRYNVRYSEERAMWSNIDLRSSPPPPKDRVNLRSVAALERQIEEMERAKSVLLEYRNWFNRAQFADETLKAQIVAGQLRGILERIGTRAHAYLSSLEPRLLFAAQESHLLNSHIMSVDNLLGEVAPEVLKQFASCYERILTGDDEALSHAAGTCRRVLEAIADHVYPPLSEPVSGSDAKSHDVGPSRFANRLIAFVDAKTRTTSLVLFSASIADLSHRLDALVSLTNKGVHDRVTIFEANQCALQTYILAGDILSLQAA